MLNRFRSAANQVRSSYSEKRGVRRPVVQERARACVAEDAYDAAQYFVDDVKDPWCEDALERERSSQHAQLRELVVRGDASGLRDKLDALGSAATIIANLTPGGANTLLYVASELGNLAAASVLVGAGADGRAHPVTKYGPLYIACYHGHSDIATLLLAHFPEAVQQETVEKWLPLHAACIGGHPSLVKLLLEYQYPAHLLTTYTDPSGQYQYRMAFDVNARDASGQSALYVACTLGNAAVVDALLEFSLPVLKSAQSPPKEATQSEPRVITSPHRSGISLGIHAIVNKLTGGNKTPAAEAERRVRPVRADSGRGLDTCVACAARLGHARVLRRLLAAGARPDACAEMVSEAARDPRRRSRSASVTRGRASPAPAQAPYNDDREGWTALAVAARARNVQIVEMLLAAGATDPGGKALRECARHGLTDLVASLLATKAYPDPEYKLNKSAISETVLSGKEADSALSFSARCPTTPVMVNWRELRCQLSRLRMCWLRAAASRVNSKLSAGGLALLALTRLELANNELRELPRELFSLISLRYLNAAQNKLERLPTVNDPFEEEYDGGRVRRKRGERKSCSVYTAPVLQELYLQDNRLEELPAELFSLPALASLDVSNNKLRSLPARVWRAPSLRDLNAALNHLKELPGGDETNNESVSSVSSPSESPLPGASPSSNSAPYGFSQTKSASRSPSIENSDATPDDEDIPVLGNRTGNAVWSEARRAHAWRGARAPSPVRAPAGPGASCLASLNLSHNQFSCVPPPLACRAPALTRLNMAYNGLRSMSYVTSYPTNLRQLDLSHNEISCWPSLPQVDSFGGADGSPLACYCPNGGGGRARPRSGGSVRSQLLSAACPARRHLRLEALRTLILANNMLTRIQLTTDDDGLAPAADHRNNDDNDDEWSEGEGHLKRRLLFPLLSMLDVSCNILRSVPPAIYLLSNLAVLNLSGNKDITDLPPQMGLLSRLWNLNTVGCSLSEPLRSVVRGGRSRSVDVVGFLRSVLHEAKPYARMKLMIVGVQGIGKTSLLECLRQESAVQHRRKPTDHWAKRMGNRSTRGMSTVGVDIGSWMFEPQRAARGPVTFSTWDFGGQHEYYSTHQYFLSRRSLYLVVWKVPDGKKGLASALQWLRSIQARAPGSPVIMVGTHYDQVNNSNLPESESPMALQRLIRGGVMGAPDADKLGLPRVLDTIEVSCSTRHNIKLLADIIYSVAFSVKPPGSKEPMLEQRVPATYLALEECVVSLATELKEPVLRHEQYRKLVTQYMQQKNLKMFRDAAELHQATMFLHENGVLLHYDDATLKELYFLRPQWLCDILAHVVTVREINPFANNGIMKVEDLAHVFKASPALGGGEEARSLGMSLLNKFELALCWDGRALLVPPLLPASEPPQPQPQLALKSRTWPGTPRRMFSNTLSACDEIRNSEAPLTQDCGWGVTLSCRDSGRSLRRILLMSYVPCGFWARLCARLLSDSAVAATAADLYRLPLEIEQDENLSKALELNWSWKVWKTGVKLVCGQLTLLSLREIPPTRDPLLGSLADDVDTEELYHHMRFRVRQEGVWCELDMQTSACIEILLPAQACVAKRKDGLPLAGYQSITLEPNPAVLARVLALVSDLLDLLLEDWYPSLGTRFVHTSEGRCLITRVVPCPSCLRDASQLQSTAPHLAPHPDLHENNLAQALKRLELGNHEPRRLRLSEESRASDRDSGVGNESISSSRLGSVEGVQRNSIVGECWTLEECILAGCTGKRLVCHHHADIELADVAPDVLLLDVEDSKRARWEHVTLGAVVGRGAFGTVVAGTWRAPGAEPRRVALKALQPVPAQPHSIPALTAYKAAVSRWDREPLAAACRAYCGLRQELGILSRLRHSHVVPLLAACPAPLALLLAIAPQGSLESTLRGYRGCGARVGARSARALTMQLARALEYLHAHRVLYRDLKSENVLVWSFPAPSEARVAENSPDPIDVHVKLGDYGISRLAPPSGTKGFGGTEGFMAPEIMRYNGEEEYTEKVDCFSFGMLLYEIFTLRQPFEGHEAVKEAVLEGARPPLSPRDLQYPCSMLETMRRCWSGAPELRPSAAALVAVAAAPEFLSLRDAAVVRQARAAAATPIANVTEENAEGWEIWYGGAEPERAHTLMTSATTFHHHHSLTVPPDKTDPVIVTSMCRVGHAMWLGDSVGRVSVYSISECALLWSVKVCEAVGGGGGGVAALHSLESLRRVALALSCGRLFLVSCERPQAESTFVLTELGTATELNCLAAVHTDNGLEVWAGGDGLYTYTLTAEGVSAAESVPAPARPSRLAHLAASCHAPTVLAACKGDVYVYAYSAASREQTARLDCSKLAPSSESLQSIASDDPLTEERCRITSLCVCGTEAYVGTLWGCVIVADAATLRPLAVCRPHEGEVRSILPLYPHGNANYPMLATLGDGYRPLLNRYAPSQSGNTSTSLSGYYCLLWRTQHWLPD